MIRSRLAAISAAAVVTAALSTTAAAAPATAVDVYALPGGRTTAVILTHAETVAAAKVGAGAVINAVLGNDRWGVTLERESRYRAGNYYRPEKQARWNNVTGQQVIAEAAAHPGGRVALGITPSNPLYPLWVQQVW